ncbi:MAG: c-type cytochrome [Pirellulaceae bacterium]|nr:c-type cytochrome [Pirellulaceae bacterium]
MRKLPLASAAWLALAAAALAADPTPQWIWPNNKPAASEIASFRKTIDLAAAPKSALFFGSCDNLLTLFVNGEQVATSSEWQQPIKEDLTKRLKAGKNVIAVRGTNQGGQAAFIAQIHLEAADGTKTVFVTDGSWQCSLDPKEGWQQIEFDASAWKAPHSFGKLGVGPWGDLAIANARPAGMAATDSGQITTLPGFEVELLYSVPKDTQGSWVSLASDDKGRLIASDQYGGLFRITPGDNAETTKIEPLSVAIGDAQGLLWAYGSLYVVVNGGKAQGSGLYRVRDTDGDDQLDEVRLLKKLEGGGEHGPHGVRLGPDGKIYVIAGNFTKPPAGYDPTSPHRNWAEDQLLPRNPDGGGHDPHIMAPGGWLARTDAEGKNWELLCAGMRNAYDFDFNQDGEIFTYDSDMEWDTGAPWYRPTRVNHLVSGGEYGWRNGTGKWPEYSPDSLGAVVNIGLGSPTGVACGTGAKFPARYQRALFINDWTYGKIYAVHLTPSGGTYSGSFEVFVSGRPLPVTDLVVHGDGHLYFAIGGRRTQSGLYRVKYTGSESTAPVGPLEDAAAAKSRELRRSLEALHARTDPAVIEAAWPHLNSGDRSIRYAARIAIEHQDSKLWADRAFAEKRTTAAIQALLALARTASDKSLAGQISQRLNSLPLERMTEEQLLAATRAYALTFIRLGPADEATSNAAAQRLAPLFPNQSEAANRELAALLVYLKSPAVIEPAMKLLATGQTQEDQLYYVLVLRNIADLLSANQRRAFFGWINLAESSYRGGASFKKFLVRIRQDAAEKLTAADRNALKEVIEGKQKVEVVKLETTRQFLHNWQMEDLLPLAAEVESGRSFEKGRLAYEAAQCAKCHRFVGQGGDTGPDITGVGNRFNTQYLLESLIVPSKAVSDQYLGSVIRTLDGEIITGRVLEENDKTLKVRTDPFARELVTIAKDNIEERQQSRVSEMPQGLVNVLTKEEILDLIAFLRSAGNPQDKAFLPGGK